MSIIRFRSRPKPPPEPEPEPEPEPGELSGGWPEREMDDGEDCPRDFDDNPMPPFDAFQHFLGPTDIHGAMRAAREIDSSVKRLEDVCDDPDALADLDAYFKRVWMKHHG